MITRLMKQASSLKRPGFTLAEASLGLVLAMAGSALVVNLAITGLQHASLMDEKFLAQEELNNLKERSQMPGANPRTGDWTTRQTLSRIALDRLDKAQLLWKIEFVNPLTGKMEETPTTEVEKAGWPIRFTATIRWKVEQGGSREVSSSWILAPISLKTSALPAIGGV